MKSETKYIFSKGDLSRKDFSIKYKNETGNFYLPIEKIKEIYCFNELTLSTKLLDILSTAGIVVHFFNYYENYIGTFYPKKSLISGKLTIKQAKAFEQNRLTIAKAIVKGIPYKILFKVVYKEDYCYAIKPNENIYYTEWNEDINIDFEGLTLESIYDRIIKQIIKEETNQKSIEDILIDRAKIDDLNKKINQLTQKVKSENQFDRKVALNCELNRLKREMEELNNG